MQDHDSSPRVDSAGNADLPEEVIRRIDAYLASLGELDFYALLGLARNATRAQVRSAFLAVAPPFHPDKYFGRKLGVYGERMQRVFAQMSVAHDTLVNDAKRAEYDAQLPPPTSAPTPPPPASSPLIPPASAPPPASERVLRAEPGSSSARFRAASPSNPDLERAAQQAFAMRLGGKRIATPVPGSQRGVTPVKPFAPAPSVVPAAGTAASSAAAVEALKRRYEASKARGPAPATPPQAAPKPSDADVAAEVSALVDRAREAEHRQEFGEAGGHWAHAFELAPTNGEVAHRAALCFRRAGSDPRRAARYGEEAVKLDPNKAGYRATLALLYVDVGLGLRARGEVERAMKLDPQNPQVKEAAAKVKTMK